MDKKIVLVTGGQRSGKSAFAEKLALELSEHPLYVATARIWDSDFAQRVEKHQKRRGLQWTTIEEEKYLGQLHVDGCVVLIDCCTLWATNFLFDLEDPAECQKALQTEFDQFTSQNAVFIFVTNEIGMGGVSENELQRKFCDLQGWLNQYVAAYADDVYLLVSGIPMKIK